MKDFSYHISTVNIHFMAFHKVVSNWITLYDGCQHFRQNKAHFIQCDKINYPKRHRRKLFSFFSVWVLLCSVRLMKVRSVCIALQLNNIERAKRICDLINAHLSHMRNQLKWQCAETVSPRINPSRVFVFVLVCALFSVCCHNGKSFFNLVASTSYSCQKCY